MKKNFISRGLQSSKYGSCAKHISLEVLSWHHQLKDIKIYGSRVQCICDKLLSQ